MTTPSGQVIYCYYGDGPATVLVIANNMPGQPCCDEHARRWYGVSAPDRIRLAPLSEYVDMFAEARQALFATPGQVISGEPATVEAPPTAVGTSAPASNDSGSSVGGSPEPAAPKDPTWKILGSMAAASFVAGIGLCVPQALGWQASSSTPGTLTGFGVILIVLAALVGLVAAGVAFSKGLAKERAWKATLTPEQRFGVEVAETAALYATWGAVHHHVQKVKAENAATYQARSAAYRTEQAQQQQNQMAADLRQLASAGSPQAPRVPGPTQHSDIYGNLV